MFTKEKYSHDADLNLPGPRHDDPAAAVGRQADDMVVGRDIAGCDDEPGAGAVGQARATGKGAPRLIEQPIRELLKQPVDEVRKALNIPEPTKYRECHRIWREEGIDPYDLLSGDANESEALAA